MLICVSPEIQRDRDELHALVAFGFRGVDGHDVEIHLRPIRNSRQSFCGRAYPERPARASLAASTRYLVVLFLPRYLRNRAYPKTYRYPGLKTAPLIVVENWRERIVALVAHEACHVRQFRDGLRRSEVEAERWAASVLETYRRRPTPEPAPQPLQLILFASAAS